MSRVMERRNLLAGLLVLVVSMFMLAGTASAHSAHKSKKTSSSPKVLEPIEEHEEAACEIIANPGAVPDIGEFGFASSIATILEVECKATYAEKKVRIASNELWAKCNRKLKWLEPGTVGHALFGAIKKPEAGENGGKEFKAELDDDGNATVVVFGGPSCAAEGGALVTADLESGTHPTATTEVFINEPEPSEAGIHLYPEPGAIEDATDSSLAGMAIIEFPPGYAEELISITDRQLFEKCLIPPKLVWFGPTGIELPSFGGGVETINFLDNDGNAFVVFEGGESCKSGNTLFEASLIEPPYTTEEGTFKIFPPQSTFGLPH